MTFSEDLSTTKQVHALNSIDGRMSLVLVRKQLMVNYWTNLQGYSTSPTKDVLQECRE